MSMPTLTPSESSATTLLWKRPPPERQAISLFATLELVVPQHRKHAELLVAPSRGLVLKDPIVDSIAAVPRDVAGQKYGIRMLARNACREHPSRTRMAGRRLQDTGEPHVAVHYESR
jgi:hypothetical protein